MSAMKMNLVNVVTVPVIVISLFVFVFVLFNDCIFFILTFRLSGYIYNIILFIYKYVVLNNKLIFCINHLNYNLQFNYK
jgi:hypothetical protein